MKKIEPKMETPQSDTIQANLREKPLVKELEPVKETKITISLPMILFALAIIVAGGVTGYVLAGGGGNISIGGATQSTSGKSVANVAGIDCKMKGEIPEGILKKGGIDGEGSHHLERDGDPARNVYLTSSVIPLDDYIGKKVRLCGTTFDAENAGWFMDVERLEVLE